MRSSVPACLLLAVLPACSSEPSEVETTAPPEARSEAPAFPDKSVTAAVSFTTRVAIPGMDLEPVDLLPTPDGDFLVMFEHGPARVTRPPPDLDDVVGDLNRFAATASSDGVSVVRVYADGSASEPLDLTRPDDQARYGVGLAALPGGSLLAVTNPAFNISNARGYELTTLSSDGRITNRGVLHEGETLRIGAFDVTETGLVFVAGSFHADTLGQDWVWDIGAEPPPPTPEGHSGLYWALLTPEGEVLWERRAPVDQVGSVTGARFGADGHPCFATSEMDRSLTVTCVLKQTGATRWTASGDSGAMYADPWLFQRADGAWVAAWKSFRDSQPTLRIAVHSDEQRTEDHQIAVPESAEELTSVVATPGGYLALFEENYSGREVDIDAVHIVEAGLDGTPRGTRSVIFERISGDQIAVLDHQGRIALLHGSYQDDQLCFDLMVGDERFQPTPVSDP